MSPALMQPHHHVPYPGPHYRDYHPAPTTRTQGENTTVALPSIRQAFPDFDNRRLEQERLRRRPSPDLSPTGIPVATSPKYTVSPTGNKRRRVSCYGGNELQSNSPVPRVYALPQHVNSQPQSPASESHLIQKRWIASDDYPRPDTNNDAYLSMRSPNNIKTHERAERLPPIPSLPPLKLEHSINESIRIDNIPMHGHVSEAYMTAASRRPSLVPSNGQWTDAGGHGYRPPTYDDYGYHPNRVQSLSVGSAHFDRTPFSSGMYGSRFHEPFMRMGDGGIGTNGDGKQRKRRGNLPKETTDKLRSWFLGHLSHPYPTEDEKQELMRETGLQMNQISNWFINARRRQLPTMINNARAESDAMNCRVVEGKTLPPNERIDHDRDSKHHSDSEGSHDDDITIKQVKQHKPTNMKRGSI
ncbi:hypothetical protein F5Y10DRAFT_262004 [Nemania abortiva]|nr:hypothetical protein F5Y10DRAFT_262004 [Nemania abortiva]